MLILQLYFLQRARELLADVHAPRADKRRQIRHAPRGIVVAAYRQHCRSVLRQRRDKVVEGAHRLGLRRAALIYVPRDDHGLRPLLARDAPYLAEYVHLILYQRHIVQPLAEVQVRRVYESHSLSPRLHFFLIYCSIA